MKLKYSFGHVFQGNASPVELLQVFLTIAVPVIIVAVIYAAVHHY